MCGYLSYIPMPGDATGVNGVRALRALRPLRAINAVPGLKMLVKCLMESLPLLVDNFFLLLWLFFVFGIISLNVFMGRLRARCMYFDPSSSAPGWAIVPGLEEQVCGFWKCPAFYSYDNSTGLPLEPPLPPSLPPMQPPWGPSAAAPNATSSPGDAHMVIADIACRDGNANPDYGFVGFDNFGMAAYNIFNVITLDNWTQNQLFTLWNAMGPGVPVTVFVFVIIFCVFFGLQLFVAIMSSKFAQIAAAVSQSMQHHMAPAPARTRAAPACARGWRLRQHGTRCM